MFFKPSNELLWDNWIFYKDGIFYLFYLRISKRNNRWDGVSLATSKDLVHFEEYGEILNKSDDAFWLGTGMVVEKDNKFYMNYSEEYPIHNQHILFAVSEDLFHWKKIGKTILYPDGKYYLNDTSKSMYPYPRWDSIGVFKYDDFYYGFLTASTNNPVIKGREGTVGLVKSSDLLNWECLPSPLETESEYPNYEVVEHLEFNNRHYMLFSTNSKAGFNYENDGYTGGTYYLVSNNALSNYTKPIHDNMLIGSRNFYNVTQNYVGRTIKDGKGRTIFYHIYGNPQVDGISGTPKIIEEIEPYKLGLKYFLDIDNYLGQNLFKGYHFKLRKKNGVLNPIDIISKDSFISVRTGNSGLINIDIDEKIIKEKTFKASFEFKILNGNGFGLTIDSKTYPLTVYFNKEQSKLNFSYIEDGWECNLTRNNLLSSELSIDNKKHNAIILFSNCCVEVYVDGLYISSLRLENELVNNYGFYFDDVDCEISNFCLQNIL